MYTTVLRTTLLFVVLVLSALAGAPREARADLRIVATTPDLAALAREIGGEHARVTSLALHTQDPHWVDARPHLALELARADLLIAVGLQLEVGWLPTLQTGARNGDIQVGGQGYLDCSTLVTLLEVPTVRVDRSMGDVHPGGNPHYMLDPRRATRVAAGIGRRMAALDPSNADYYGDRTRALLNRIDRARQRWEERLAVLRAAKVVAYHRSFAYLADWLGLRVLTHLEPRPGIPPNPRHVAQVLARARAERARLILQETYYPTSTSRVVAERSGAKLVVLPGGPDFREGETYVDFLDRIGGLLERGAAR